ncbi:MAG TPA: tetratricopeptide repeat protein, partial [Gammaproteobacteria bacterium]
MPRIVSHLILCVLAFSVHSPAQADTSSDREEFRTAYAEYQALAGEGRHEEALPAARRAYELGAALYGSQDRNTAALALNLGKSLRHAGLQEEAIDVLKDALAAYEKIYGKEAMELVDPLMELGHVMARPGQSGWQRKYYVRALRIVEDYEGADSVLYGNLNLEVGTQIMVQAQTRDCLTYLQRAYVIFSTKLGSDDVRPTLAAVQLGKYYFSIHDFDEAERFLLEALDRAEGLNESDSLTKLGVHTLLVVFYEEQGERTRASEH